MLKTLNMALVCRPVGLSEEIIAVFEMKKSQIDTENDKNPISFLFSKVLCNFSKFSTDFVNFNVEKGQQRKKGLSSLLRKEIKSVFQRKTVRNRHLKKQF